MTWTDQYSTLDRFVHRVAFAGIELQKAVADIEDRIYAGRFQHVTDPRPVFITSLPRAGTTLLLELVSALPEFATHTYRNMPFLMCPMIWDRLSRGFRKTVEKRERAHGDGVMIDFDSAEAFEEAFWQAWWPSKYDGGHVELWDGSERNADFEGFFGNHLRKVVALAGEHTHRAATRYVSKNNANIARLPFLTKLYPNCRVLIPVRDPIAHIRSLHRQHLRFLDAHADDGFAKQYMRAIGHLDFGENLVPIQFPDFSRTPEEATSADFWLDYWISAYGMLASFDMPQVRFVSFEALYGNPENTIRDLMSAIDADETSGIASLVAKVSKPSTLRNAERADCAGLDDASLERAYLIYRDLIARADGHGR
jgi:hypothetical protein